MIKNLEDLQVWQKARILSQKIYKITASFPVSEKNILISQLRRASNS
ncbi:MAG: four helix bundle protein [Candidatus Levybacteria bacterium]|nr:four helix bundle protein [Candidatus Levybacteria bacterium]